MSLKQIIFGTNKSTLDRGYWVLSFTTSTISDKFTNNMFLDGSSVGFGHGFNAYSGQPYIINVTPEGVASFKIIDISTSLSYAPNFTQVVKLSNGHYVCCGYASDGSRQGVVGRFNESGTQLFMRQFGATTSGYEDYGAYVGGTTAGKTFVLGYYRVNASTIAGCIQDYATNNTRTTTGQFASVQYWNPSGLFNDETNLFCLMQGTLFRSAVTSPTTITWQRKLGNSISNNGDRGFVCLASGGTDVFWGYDGYITSNVATTGGLKTGARFLYSSGDLIIEAGCVINGDSLYVITTNSTLENTFDLLKIKPSNLTLQLARRFSFQSAYNFSYYTCLSILNNDIYIKFVFNGLKLIKYPKDGSILGTYAGVTITDSASLISRQLLTSVANGTSSITNGQGPTLQTRTTPGNIIAASAETTQKITY